MESFCRYGLTTSSQSPQLLACCCRARYGHRLRGVTDVDGDALQFGNLLPKLFTDAPNSHRLSIRNVDLFRFSFGKGAQIRPE